HGPVQCIYRGERTCVGMETDSGGSARTRERGSERERDVALERERERGRERGGERGTEGERGRKIEREKGGGRDRERMKKERSEVEDFTQINWRIFIMKEYSPGV